MYMEIPGAWLEMVTWNILMHNYELSGVAAIKC
jgi:hypothetical protein